jgi:phytol kinase
VSDIELALVLGAWVLFVAVVLTRWTYGPPSRRFGHMRAVYFDRKIIHVLAGGLVAVLVPFFSSWVVPTGAALVIALFLYIPHKTGRLLWWFQDPDNMYEVSFAVMWALAVALGWGVLGDWRLGLVPALLWRWGTRPRGL